MQICEDDLVELLRNPEKVVAWPEPLDRVLEVQTGKQFSVKQPGDTSVPRVLKC